MLRLGITGGIGSGKSTVCAIFSQLGIPAFNADTQAKEIVNNEPKLQKKIIELLGENAFIDGVYNRTYVASQVFSNPILLEKLNQIIHPAVFNLWSEFCKQNSTAPYVIKEAAIMLETDSRYTVDKIALVYSPLELRIERITKRDNFSRDEIIHRINNQMKDEDKLNLADFIIYNDNFQSLILQVYQLHNQLIKNGN